MSTFKVKAVTALLEAEGWVHVRTRGDHRIYRKNGEPRPIPVPGHFNDDLAEGTLKSILRQAGLEKESLNKN
jgi:predicted RNA binding protein YcfA (HicA-like mRNA interferase family)